MSATPPSISSLQFRSKSFNPSLIISNSLFKAIESIEEISNWSRALCVIFKEEIVIWRNHKDCLCWLMEVLQSGYAFQRLYVIYGSKRKAVAIVKLTGRRKNRSNNTNYVMAIRIRLFLGYKERRNRLRLHTRVHQYPHGNTDAVNAGSRADR
ncbi:hypothetical protein QVD17_09537 [Tagetes erecta]|uniref:Uncharacterized protein n=1 Tax=Tagetes erecta TaxID=13708 RepID=A0AAD8L1N0_TARER|nr:hypothetical protein QVD17_09537 [Tagetes erecta]